VVVLARFGVVRRLELRFTGYLFDLETTSDRRDTGAGPPLVGLKYNLQHADGKPYRPSIALEFQVELPLATAAFDEGFIQPSASFNFDHALPGRFSFHWSIDHYTTAGDDGRTSSRATSSGHWTGTWVERSPST